MGAGSSSASGRTVPLLTDLMKIRLRGCGGDRLLPETLFRYDDHDYNARGVGESGPLLRPLRLLTFCAFRECECHRMVRRAD